MNELISLSEFFTNKIIKVPIYQRGYSWENKQLTDFWEDLITLEENQHHYTGMLSLKESTNNNLEVDNWFIKNKNYKVYHIVDGQQRITTCLILLNSLLIKAKNNNIEYLNGDYLDDIYNEYIIEYVKPDNIIYTYKFSYEEDENSTNYLFSKIFKKVSTCGNIQKNYYTSKLQKAENFFEDKIKNLTTQELEKIYRKLINNFKFILYIMDDNFDVSVAFETMNTRGKTLSNLEILKNRLMYLVNLSIERETYSTLEKNKILTEINNCWKTIYYQLGRNKSNLLDDDEYLKNHWYLYFKYSRNYGNEYINFLLNDYFSRKKLSERKLTLTNIKDYIISLSELSEFWYYTFNPADYDELCEEEIEWISKLNHIGIGYFRPLILASLKNEELNSTDRINLYKIIERFIFINFKITNYNSIYKSNNAYIFAKKLLHKEENINNIISFYHNLIERNMNECKDSFIKKIKRYFDNNNGFYSWSSKEYFFFEYEEYLSKNYHSKKINNWDDFVLNEKDKISIEHIYPQTPECNYWNDQFEHLNEDQRKILTNSLGNLLPLSKSINSSLQNIDFNSKKERGYLNGSCSEMEVAKFTDWNPNSILERGFNLLKFMEKRWKLNFSKDEKYKILGLEFMK